VEDLIGAVNSKVTFADEPEPEIKRPNRSSQLYGMSVAPKKKKGRKNLMKKLKSIYK